MRKVLGATVSQIVALLSSDFLKLVLAGLLVGSPLAYLAMQQWLRDFAYRTDLGPLLFLGVGVLALAISFLAVSYHSIRAALLDPARTLRYE